MKLLHDNCRAGSPDNPVFCMLPWTSLHVAVDGSVLPCCLANAEGRFGSVRSQSLEAVWNSAGLRALRLDMLNGRPSSICSRCYEQESSGFNSLRQCANADYGHHQGAVTDTRKDGSLPRLRIAYLDIRFSNLCNLQCRTCEPLYSTAWYRYVPQRKRPGRVHRARDDSASLLQEIEPLLDDVEQIYFAGGEPTLMHEHYELLEMLLAKGRTDVRLSYSTNYSTFRYKHWNLLALWKQFSNVNVGASLDASGLRGEYLRKGQRWEQVVKNRWRQLAECPHVSFNITSTLSNMNCLHLPNFHEEWVEQGLIGAGEVHINILQIPSYFRLDALPGRVKHRVRDRYLEHIDYLSAHPGCESAMRGYLAAITFMQRQDASDQLPAFRRAVAEQDTVRNESFAHTFPELGELLDPGENGNEI